MQICSYTGQTVESGNMVLALNFNLLLRFLYDTLSKSSETLSEHPFGCSILHRC